MFTVQEIAKMRETLQDSREIRYEREGPLTVCPCCGGRTIGQLFACMPCWDLDESENIRRMSRFDDRTTVRHMFYALGLRLRAEGKMAAVVNDFGHWVKTPGGVTAWWASGSRERAIEQRALLPDEHGGVLRSPVQRKSDPNPFENPPTAGQVRVLRIGEFVWEYPPMTPLTEDDFARTEAELARALFETDPRLNDILTRHGDYKLREPDGSWIYCESKRREAIELFWAKGIPLRLESEARARDILVYLRKDPVVKP